MFFQEVVDRYWTIATTENMVLKELLLNEKTYGLLYKFAAGQ